MNTLMKSCTLAVLCCFGLGAQIPALQSGQTQQCAPAATVWTLTPPSGSVSPTGLYTAPAQISEQQTVKITSATDPVTCSVILLPTVPPITLPIEVVGPDGTSITIPFLIPLGSPAATSLALTIHNLKYETEASFKIDSASWTPLNTATVTLLGLAKAYGGIGGGFSTLSLTAPAPVAPGVHAITFRFNGSDGRTSGFRILTMNFQDSTGAALLSGSAFLLDDPSKWTPPLDTPADIAAGKAAFQKQNSLRTQMTGPTVNIKAACSDCHARDGRDLKYFNYSNASIRARSMFHGLTVQQGDQIASYIRSLNVPSPGRPWNPPYQPGPGLDSQPVTNWAAGAGLGAVLDHDADMLPAMGSPAGWAPTANLSAREVPITFQLMDWNTWLPQIHPMDAWPGAFPTSPLFTNYQTILSKLVPQNPTSYKAYKFNIWNWASLDHFGFFQSVNKPGTDPAWKDPQYRTSIQSLEMWSMVKLWEINQEFGLEGMAQTVFGAQSDTRAWYTAEPFFVSPGFNLPTTAVGNGLLVTFQYHSMTWYHLQLLLNAGNNRGTGLGPAADFPYTYNYLDKLSTQAPQGLMLTLWLIKGLQSSENGKGPEAGSGGWQPSYNAPWRLVYLGPEKWDPKLTPEARAAVMEGYLNLWLGKVTSYTPQKFYAGGWAKATDVTDPHWQDQGFSNSIAYMIPRFKYYGVSSTTIDRLIDWAKTLWPNYKWDSLRNVMCAPAVPDLACSNWP